MRKLATVSEVMGGQAERRGKEERSGGGGSGSCTAVSTQPRAQAQPQMVTSACSCARTFVLFTTLVCHVENSWAEMITHTKGFTLN